MSEKTFNTAGPCDPGRNYMLPPEARLGKVAQLIDQASYFVVHAPRQCGKTTSFRALASRLTAEGRYTALLASCEAAQARISRQDGNLVVTNPIYREFLPEALARVRAENPIVRRSDEEIVEHRGRRVRVLTL